MSSYTKIVVGVDGSDTSMRALDHASAIAGADEARLLIVSAYEPARAEDVKAGSDALREDAYLVVGSAPAEAMLREAATRARSGGAAQVDTLAVQGPPVAVLDQTVVDTAADLVVVGDVGLNTLTGRVFGSVPQKVARQAGVDVLIAHTS